MESSWSGSGAELSASAREVIYTIRHVIRDEPLDDELARRHARALVLEPVMGVSPEQEYLALGEALASEAPLSTWRDDPRYERVIPESEFRAHLRRVVRQLDVMRPWPVPLVRALAPERWSEYTGSRVVGRIHLRVSKVESRIRANLLPMLRLDGPEQVRVAILELRSGREVALVGRWWPDDLRSTAVLTRDPDVPAGDLMAELTSGDEFAPDEYDVIG